MKVEQKDIGLCMRNFEDVCRNHGIKLTHQRIEIFREIAKSTDHPDAELIFQRVKGRMPTVSLDTVYRTLWTLKELGLIVTLGSTQKRARFDANLKRHHHFVCKKCGWISDFYSKTLNTIPLPETVTSLGTIETTHLEVRGICQQCMGKNKKKTKVHLNNQVMLSYRYQPDRFTNNPQQQEKMP